MIDSTENEQPSRLRRNAATPQRFIANKPISNDTSNLINQLSNEYVYGMNPAFEVLLAGRREVREALVARKGAPKLQKLLELLKERNIPVKTVEKGILNTTCGSREHQGVALLVSSFPYDSFEALLDASRLLLLDNVEDPRNVGAILRSAEIFGFNHVLLPSKGVPGIYPSVVKSSAGATEHLRVCAEGTANRYLRSVKEAGFKVVALDGKGKDILKPGIIPEREKIMLVTGGENYSVGQFILNNADHTLRIDQKGRINSLNTSVAAGIAMHVLS